MMYINGLLTLYQYIFPAPQVEEAVREKRRCFKLWKAGGSRAAYNTAKCTSNRVVHQAKSEAEKVALQKIDARSGDVYRLAKQMRRDNQDVMGEKPVKNDAGQLSLDEESKKEAWKEHYERLLNVEFPWNPEGLSEESPVEGPSEPITLEMITKAITKMASGKAAGPSGIVAEMLKPVGKAGAEEVRDLVENIISEGCIPTDWQESFIVNLYKGKGDALNRGNYRGLKLIEQVMKVLERVVEGLIRQRVEIDEMQCGFMSGHALLMRFLLYVSYRRSTWLPTSPSTWPSLTWRKHLIVFHGMSSGWRCAN